MKNYRFHLPIVLLLSILSLFPSCKPSETKQQLVIAVSKERRTEANRYVSWLEHQKIALRTIDLSLVEPDAIDDSLAICHGLLLTGGADIFPGNYGKEFDTIRCGYIDQERDAYEFLAYKVAKELGLPIVGICRGMQLINIAEGGTLYIDLPADFNSGELHRIGNEDWATHKVSLQDGSSLSKLVDQSGLEVASNHHQGIELLAPTLRMSAQSEDGLTEAIEWKNDDSRSFLLAVQWHPEWMDRTDTLSGKIAHLFLKQSEKFRQQHQ